MNFSEYEKMDDLPNKLSSLLSLALDDMKKVQKDDRYILDMAVYHSLLGSEKVCRVCLAGSVMAKTLGFNSKLTLHPYDLNYGLSSKLSAIDKLRSFDILGAKEYLRIATDKDGRGNYYYNLFLSKLNHVFCVLFLRSDWATISSHPQHFIKIYRYYVWFLRLLRL